MLQQFRNSQPCLRRVDFWWNHIAWLYEQNIWVPVPRVMLDGTPSSGGPPDCTCECDDGEGQKDMGHETYKDKHTAVCVV